MSANLDLVRSIYADWGHGDFSSAEWAHPDIEFVLADGPDPGRWTGITAATEAWTGRLSAWDEFRNVADDFLDLDDERVLVLVQLRGRGKTSGMELESLQHKGAHLLHVNDGTLTRLVLYVDRERALADLGLEE